MKKFLIATAFILFSIHCTAQTYISGFISQNTTWNVAGSPYIVTGNTLLSHGYTLTIEPGVIVKFDTDKALQIDGQLIAIGTPASRIVFTSNQAVPAPGDWAKIHFPDTCVDAIFDSLGNFLSGSIMNYCDVSYGGGLGFGEIHIDASAPYISHCNISFSSSDGIRSTASIFLVDSSTIQNCYGNALSFYNYHFHQNSVLLIQDDSLLNNFNGVYLAPATYNCPGCSVIIRRNAFISNSHGAINGNGGTNSNEIVSENYFINNLSSGGFSIVEIKGVNYIVECNHFLFNQTNGQQALKIEDFASDAAFIRNNIFYGNGPASVFHVNCNYGSTYQHIYFINNWIENNSTPNGSLCFVEGYPVANNTGLFHISNNHFLNNQAANTLELFTATNQNNNTLRYAYIKENNFMNPSVQYEIKNNLPYGDPNIYADSNYWGGLSTQHIDSVIYDYFDFANQTVVYYMPILSIPATIDTICKSFNTSAFEAEGLNISLTIFPNPFSEKTTMTFNTELRKGVLSIYNVYGQKVFEKSELSGSEITFDRGQLTSGVFFYSIIENGKIQYSGKLIVQ